MSNAWPARAKRLNRIYPVEVARAVHFPVMAYFVVFIGVHVFLVFFTGALKALELAFVDEQEEPRNLMPTAVHVGAETGIIELGADPAD